MPRFTYTARDQAGKTVAAELEAPSRKDALRVLGARGLQVAAVSEVAGVGVAKPKGKAAAKAAGAPARAGQRGGADAADRSPLRQGKHRHAQDIP